MLGRKRTQLTFGQVEASRRVGEGHFLRKMDKAVNWRPMEQLLEGLYTSRRGRLSLSASGHVQGPFASAVVQSFRSRFGGGY